MKVDKKRTSSILNPICRGMVGYVSYLASCSCSQVYSEYLLYEPILRIAQSKGYSVNCEYPININGTKNGKVGDHKRIDFDLFRKKGRCQERIGIEVKWAKSKSIDLDNDINKLETYAKKNKKSSGYVVVFGKTANIDNLKITNNQKPLSKGTSVTWKAGKTSYSAKWYRFI